ncbi:MAG: preprotein translocase subunit SecG [Turicibacter sp.]|nr:preprotein translocase subunit SecG [Turicibacter sp.]
MLYNILAVIYILACAGLMTLILLQKKRAGGIGSVAGMGNADTYWDKNKSRSIEGAFERWTKIGWIFIVVLSVVLSLI